MQHWWPALLWPPGCSFTVYARLFRSALPARIHVAKTAKARRHSRQALLKRLVLAIFRDVAAKVKNRAPRTFSSAHRVWASQINRCEYSNCQNRA